MEYLTLKKDKIIGWYTSLLYAASLVYYWEEQLDLFMVFTTCTYSLTLVIGPQNK